MAKKTTSKSSPGAALQKAAPKKRAAAPAKKTAAKATSSNSKNDKEVSLSKIAKAKVKTTKEKKPMFQPRKIEKIIDVARLEKKMEDIIRIE